MVFASLLTGATLGLTYIALEAIGDAKPIPIDVRRLQNDATSKELSQKLGVSQAAVSEALEEIENVSNESSIQIKERQDEALNRLLWACLAVVLVFGLKYFFTRGQLFYFTKAANRLASDVRLKIFDKLMRMPMAYFNEKRTGEIQSIVTNDVAVYQTATNVVRDSIEGPIKAIVALSVVFFIQWRLGLIALAFVPVLALVVTTMGRKIKAAQHQIQADLANVTAMSQEALSGTRVIKAFSAEGYIKGIYGNLVEKQYESQNVGAGRIAKLRPIVEFLGAIAIAAILYICGHLAKMDWLNLAQIIMVVQALDQVNQGAKAITNVSSTYNQVDAAVDRIYSEVLDQPDETLQSDHVQSIDHPQGKIAFENVSFSYPDGTKALENVSFTIEPGSSLALVGPSGSGKSTIADLVLRLYDPTEGVITYDGIDYRHLKLEWLRGQFGVVPQQTFMFAGSVADNLRLGNIGANEDQLRSALGQANALPFIEQSPDGIQTMLGERGTRLSGGELQRLAIARALVSDPTVLVLDEATSNLDSHSEQIVTKALAEVMAQRTSLFIAHRLTTAARADRILVLSHGQVVEEGSHADLMAKDGAYAAMYHAFVSGVLPDDLG